MQVICKSGEKMMCIPSHFHLKFTKLIPSKMNHTTCVNAHKKALEYFERPIRGHQIFHLFHHCGLVN